MSLRFVGVAFIRLMYFWLELLRKRCTVCGLGMSREINVYRGYDKWCLHLGILYGLS